MLLELALVHRDQLLLQLEPLLPWHGLFLLFSARDLAPKLLNVLIFQEFLLRARQTHPAVIHRSSGGAFTTDTRHIHRLLFHVTARV